MLAPSYCSGFDCDWRITGELILRPTVRTGPLPQRNGCCAGADSMEQELSEGASSASLVYTLGLSFVEQVRWSSGVFWSWPPGVGVLEVLQCRPKSTAVCAQPEATQWKLQSDLWLVAASAQFGGSWGKLCCEARLVATSTRLNTLWWAPQCGKRPAIYCALFMAT